MNKISIVIPAHNEEKRIKKTLDNYISYFKNLKKRGILNFEIIVVLNACKDNTLNIVKNVEKRYKEIKHLDFKQAGKGFAIIEGFKEALKGNSELIGFVDADMATPPRAYYDLVKIFKNNKKIDGVIANRWHERSIFEYSAFKRLRSLVYNFIVRSLFLFPHRDTQCGAKLFKRGVLERNINKLVSSEWNFDVALLFCLKKEEKAKIVSVPTIWVDRDKTNINLVESPLKMILSAIRLRLIHSPFKFIVKFYRKLPDRLKISYKRSKN